MTQRKYPHAPGWKGDKPTGKAAALAITPDIGRRQRQVLDAVAAFGAAGATSDDLMEPLGLPVHLIRPRTSELEKLGKLFVVGRRKGAFGHLVTVYSVVPPTLEAQAA